MVRTADKPGPLDGLTILRFAHAFESGGGVEQHLYDLNRVLGQRNRIVTIQMQLTANSSATECVDKRLGDSRLITVPLFISKPPSVAEEIGGIFETKPREILERALDMAVRTPAGNRLLARSLLGWRKVPGRALDVQGAGRIAEELIDRWKVDLVVLHASGGSDTSEIIDVVRAKGLPICLVHHFANRRLWGVSMRQQLADVDAVGLASAVDVPSYLKGNFWNLSDAVDTDFFSRERASPVPRAVERPVLYAPGRVTPEKGQMDVLTVAGMLLEKGVKPSVVFAGRTDSSEFLEDLKKKAKEFGLEGSVIFLGPLSLAEYRDWFCVADVMLMPTRHHEGMPRTLIDSQAMMVPPVVYDIGGTREGVQHGKTGFLVQRNNTREMAQKVADLLGEPHLRSQMAHDGRAYVEDQFSLTAFAKRHESFYLSVLENASPQRSE